MLRRDSRDSGPSTLESRSSPLLWKILSKSGSGQWLVAANLSADTVDKHLEFNADDMGNLMHELCAMALKVISDSNSSGDRKSGTKRPHHAMRVTVDATVGNQDDKTTKIFKRRIRDLSVKQKTLQGSDSDIRVQAIDLIANALQPNARDETIGERWTACQLMLESGKELNADA